MDARDHNIEIIIRNESLGKFIMAMTNQQVFNLLNKQLAKVRSQAEEDRWVEVNNGVKKKRRLLKEVVVDIREDTEVLRDIKKFNSVMKKYKLWWLIGIIIVGSTGAFGLDSLVNLLKIK